MFYVLSDIHAHTKTFNNFYQTLTPADQVLCLGDTIDKGDGTLDVLKTIMNDSRFELIMGNHEHMLYKYLFRSS